MEIALVVAGGLIGLVAGISTTFLSDRFSRSRIERQEIISAYVEWSVSVNELIMESKLLEVYDHVEKLKRESADLKNIPSSPSGRSRQEHVRDKFQASSRLKTATARLLLLEPSNQFAEQIKIVSNIDFIEMKLDEELKSTDTAQQIFAYERAKLEDLEKFMQRLRDTHPQIKRN